MDKGDDKSEKAESAATRKDLDATDLADKAGGSPNKRDGSIEKTAD